MVQRRKRKKGFSLGEVMVALLIISLAFTILSTAYLSSLRNIRGGRNVHSGIFELRNVMETEWVGTMELVTAYNSYWNQGTNSWNATYPKSAEELINRVKKKYGAVLPKPEKDVYTCCGLKVSGYSVEVKSGSYRLNSFVSDKHSEVRLLAVEKVWIDSPVRRFQYLEDPSASLLLQGKRGTVLNSDLLYSLQHRWYVSAPVLHTDTGFCLPKAYLDDSGYEEQRRPDFSASYIRLPEKNETLLVDRNNIQFRDAALKYSIVPLGKNKYVGMEVAAEKLKYFIGLPLGGQSLVVHYNADMIMNYDKTADIALDASALTAGGAWLDVRSYIGMTGPPPNLFAFSNCDLMKSFTGDYVSFTKDSTGVIYDKDGSLFLRLKDLSADGNSIVLLQSPNVEAIAADKGKKMFRLTLENKKLMFYTKEVVERPSGDPTLPPTYEIVEGPGIELLADTYAGSSYAKVLEDAGDGRQGFNVIEIQFSGGALKRMVHFALDRGGAGDLIRAQEISDLPLLDAAELKEGDMEFAAEGEGSFGLSDVVMYREAVSTAFEDKVGQYLLQRYKPE